MEYPLVYFKDTGLKYKELYTVVDDKKLDYGITGIITLDDGTNSLVTLTKL